MASDHNRNRYRFVFETADGRVFVGDSPEWTMSAQSRVLATLPITLQETEYFRVYELPLWITAAAWDDGTAEVRVWPSEEEARIHYATMRGLGGPWRIAIAQAADRDLADLRETWAAHCRRSGVEVYTCRADYASAGSLRAPEVSR